MKTFTRSVIVSIGVALGPSVAVAGVSSAATPSDDTPDMNYLRSCIAALSELQTTAPGSATFPLSCDDVRMSVGKPATVTSSSVWRYGGGLLIDVGLSDKSHLRFDGKQIVIPPTHSAPVGPPAPHMRAQTTCGPSRCCTDGGYCCNWATGSPICGYGR